MRLPIAVLSLALGLLAPAAAYASPISDVTFYIVNGTTNDHGDLYGSVTINTVTGTVVSEDVFVSGVVIPTTYLQNFVFSGPVTSGDQGQNPDANADTWTLLGVPFGNGFTFDVPGTSLVGYSGGIICPTSQSFPPCGAAAVSQLDGPGYILNVTGGTLSEIDPTPEPSSLILLGTGMVGVAAAVRRRFRRN